MRKSHDRLDLLDTFVKIAEAGSLSRAARLLGTTQPTVSRRLLDLERLFGCKLALRDTARFSLTEEGRSALAEARKLLEHWDGVSERLSGAQRVPDGTLRVIGPSTYGANVLTDAATDVREAYPNVRVEMTLTDRIVDLQAAGADCWICVGRVPDTGLAVSTLGHMRRVLVAAPALRNRWGRLTVKHLSELPFVGLVPHVVGQIRLNNTHGRMRTVQIDTPVLTDHLMATYRAVLDGMGIGVAAPWICNADIDAGRLVRVLPGWTLEPIPIQVVLPAGAYRPARVRAFIDCLRRRMAELDGFTPAAA